MRLGKIPYVAVLWAALGLGFALIPPKTAQAVGERTAIEAQTGGQAAKARQFASNAPQKAAQKSSQPGSIYSKNLRVVDGDTLVMGEVRIRLYGIDAPELSQRCSDMQGASWDCGTWSKAVLDRLAHPGLSCAPKDTDRYGRTVAVCYDPKGVDVNAAMVAAGAAYAYAKYAKDYIETEQDARAGGIGLWRAAVIPPAQYRAEYRAGKRATQLASKPVQSPPEGCAIKGNISKSGKLYHLPGGRWYEGTRISTTSGERWFCSEGDAQAAGWRRAQG